MLFIYKPKSKLFLQFCETYVQERLQIKKINSKFLGQYSRAAPFRERPVLAIRLENYRFRAGFFAIEIINCYKFCHFLSISVPNFGFFGEKLTLWLGLTGNHDFVAKNQPVVGSETMHGYLINPMKMRSL